MIVTRFFKTLLLFKKPTPSFFHVQSHFAVLLDSIYYNGKVIPYWASEFVSGYTVVSQHLKDRTIKDHDSTIFKGYGHGFTSLLNLCMFLSSSSGMTWHDSFDSDFPDAGEEEVGVGNFLVYTFCL